MHIKKALKFIGYGVLGAFICLGVYLLTKHPSNTRDWAEDQIVLPYAEISGNIARIKNVRNFSYTSTSEYTKAYYDTEVDMSTIKKAYFVVEPFSGFVGAAHTFLSFEFPGDKFIAISVEIRKEKGESFSALKGLLRNYEIMYVIADERDAVKLRSNYRKDDVYVYPIRTSPEKLALLFKDMLTRANELKEKPEFYNTLTNTCTTNIVRHANIVAPDRIPFSRSVLLPASSDEFAYSLGLIDTELSFEEARKFFHINERALKYAEDPNFSRKIRE